MNLGKPTLVILCYHGIAQREENSLDDFCFVSPEKFNSDLASIAASSYRIVRLSDGLMQLQAGSLKENSVAITFDDGFISVFKSALETLKKLDAHATVFLPQRIICRQSPFWFSEVLESLESTRQSELLMFGHRLDISNHDRKKNVSLLLQRFFKNLHPNAVQYHIHDLHQSLGTTHLPRSEKYRLATEEECRSALESGFFQFGAHSASHTIHTLLSTRELESEIQESVSWVTNLTSSKCTLYAYPNGQSGDFSARCRTFLQQAGVTHALSTLPRPVARKCSSYALPRYCVGPKTDVDALLKTSQSSPLLRFFWS